MSETHETPSMSEMEPETQALTITTGMTPDGRFRVVIQTADGFFLVPSQDARRIARALEEAADECDQIEERDGDPLERWRDDG